MPKRFDNNKFIHASAIAIAISLASCGRAEPVPEAGALQATPGGKQYIAPELSGAAVLVADTGAPAEVTLPIQIEHRHFAIYSAYRVLFDDSPDVFRSRADGEGMRQAVMSDDDVGGLQGCSVRALLAQD